MKKLLTVILSSLILVSVAACSPAKKSSTANFKAGVYQGSAQGRNGEVNVEVTLSDSKIEKIEVLKHEETEGIADAAIEKVPASIVENQSVMVDVASGATITSNAIIEAVKTALISAGVDVETLNKEVKKQEKAAETKDTDVVIVGAGGTGLVAAIKAKDAGRNVIVIEKKSIAGGNTTLSTGGMNASKTKFQDENKFAEEEGILKTIKTAKEKYPELNDLATKVEEQYKNYSAKPEGYFDSVELFELDTLVGGKNLNDKELVETLTGKSSEAIDWLSTIGADLNQVGSFGGASVKRIHKPVNAEGKTVAVGSYLTPILEKVAKEKGVEIIYDTPVEEILMKDNKAVGVKAGNLTVNAKAVVITTGGFAGNLEMVEKYKPELKGFATTNTSGIVGDGIVMAEKVGAALVDMEQIQIHPTVEYNSKALITEGLRGDGAILVNAEGKRFINETLTRDVVSAAEIEQKDGYAWLVVDQGMVDKSSVIAGYIKKGYTVEGKTVEELAKAINVSEENLVNTMNTWNEAVKNAKDTEFDRTSFANPLDTAPYYAIKVSPGVHHTMGGIKINSKTEVIDTKGNVISGLYAAGEVTGGVHGANRLGGNAVADVVVFGGIAGENSAEFAK